MLRHDRSRVARPAMAVDRIPPHHKAPARQAARRQPVQVGRRRNAATEEHGLRRARARSRSARPRLMVALARRAEWHCMLTATGFIVMCVAASSTCTANAVASPPSPWGPTPSRLTADESSSSSSRRSASAQCVPRGRTAARLARCTHRSAVPPTPTPTMVGGQVRPPASSTQSTTKVLTASDTVRRHGHLEPGVVLRPTAFRESSRCAGRRSRPRHRSRSPARRCRRMLRVVARQRMHDRRAQRMLARCALTAAADRRLERNAVGRVRIPRRGR